ncbi:thiamine pyrophosphate-binding protein [Achromobacter sp.]|uniref:thiamine pyrophosphate-binding protein n=1 Tax=Achromobacter sp. TaxID=134375 RepID=UPI002F95A4FD
MTFGERLVRLLQKERVELIFSQGDLSLVEIQKHADARGVKIVCPRHEQAGVFMASGYYCMTGRPQVAMGAMGPGVANMLSSAVCAAQENIPVILIGSRRQYDTNLAVRRNRWLHAPMLEMFREPCKFAACIDTPGHLDDIVREAFRQALTGTPGPVYLEFDYSIQSREWDFPPLLEPASYRVAPSGADAASVAKAAEMIRNAHRPLLLAGSGVVRNRLHEKFRRLADRIGGPVIASLGGTGAIPECDSKYLLQFSEAGMQALRASDLVIGIGTNFPEMDGYGRLGSFSRGADGRKVLVFEADPHMAGVNRPFDHVLVGDLDRTLDQVMAELEGKVLAARWDELPQLKAGYRTEREAMAASIPETEHIHPSRLMIEARKAVPDDAVVVLDGGLTILHKIAFFEQRSDDFLYTSTFSHLGSGLGYAIGAQLASGRERPVCLLTGDGALGFHLAEFETLVRHGLPVVVIVNDDRALGAEMASHMKSMGKPVETTFSPVRYDQIARAMGGHGEYVETADEIVPAVKRAFAAGKPALVQVVTDQQVSYLYPPPYAEALIGWLENDPAAAAAQV